MVITADIVVSTIVMGDVSRIQEKYLLIGGGTADHLLYYEENSI